MKTLPQFAATIAFLALASLAHAEDKTATFKVNGMVCGSCESTVKGAVTKIDGVKTIAADAAKGTAVVTYDPAKTDETKLAAAIDTTKYKVTK